MKIAKGTLSTSQVELVLSLILSQTNKSSMRDIKIRLLVLLSIPSNSLLQLVKVQSVQKYTYGMFSILSPSKFLRHTTKMVSI